MLLTLWVTPSTHPMDSFFLCCFCIAKINRFFDYLLTHAIWTDLCVCVCVSCRRVLSYQNLRTRSFNVFGGEQRFSSTTLSSLTPTRPVWFSRQRQTLPTHFPSHTDLTGLPVAFYFNTSELPLSKLKPWLLPPDWSSTQMRQQEVFAMDSRVQPADVFCVCIRESVCVKQMLSGASAAVAPSVVFRGRASQFSCLNKWR